MDVNVECVCAGVRLFFAFTFFHICIRLMRALTNIGTMSIITSKIVLLKCDFLVSFGPAKIRKYQKS